MFGPWVETGQWIKAWVGRTVGSPFKKHRLNFITIHCTQTCPPAVKQLLHPAVIHVNNYLIDIYILSLIIIGSILLYPAGGLAYIDALFFASGAATQSGLNT